MSTDEERKARRSEDQRAKQHAVELFQEAYERQMQGQLEEAIVGYQRSVQLYPTAEAYTFLGWTYSFMARYDDAIKECLKAIEVDPDFGNPYNDIGAYLIELGRLDEAIPWLRKATVTKRYESRCFPYSNLGRVYERQGQWTEALQAYEQAIQMNPEYLLAHHALNRLKGMLS